MRKSLLICVALLFSSPAAHAQSAADILAKVSSVYAGCTSYADEATSNTLAADNRGSRHTYFRTSFVRPDSFRFELWFNASKPGAAPPWMVWKNRDLIRSSGTPGGVGVQNLRLDTGLARLAAFSGGGSIIIPQMLLPEFFRTSQLFSLIVDAKVTGEEKVDGRRAFRIEGTLLGLPIKLWIDKTDYLLLKSYRRVSIGNREEEATVQYKPKLNISIPPENLAYSDSRDQNVVDVFSSNSLTRLPTMPPLAPRLRELGSSLSSSQKAGHSAQSSASDDDVVRVETDLVVCAVLVLDAQGKIVRDLTAGDFVIKEDDKLQEVASLSLGDNKDLPRSIVLIIDYSGSQLPYIKTSVESAKMLVDKLNPKDRMAVVTDDVKLLVDFTSDKQLLKTRLESLKTSALHGSIGASEQYDALLATLNELFNNEDIRPIIIFQTDGDQLEALKGGTRFDPYVLPRNYGIEDILTASEKRRATVYSVISGVKFFDLPEAELPKRARVDWENRQRASYELMRARNFPVPQSTSVNPPDQFFATYGAQWLSRQLALASVSKFTGAVPEFLEDPSQADEIYTRVLNDIDRRYVIGYYPTNRARDGKRRKVSIEVRGHPEYTVWGQKSYFAREEK